MTVESRAFGNPLNQPFDRFQGKWSAPSGEPAAAITLVEGNVLDPQLPWPSIESQILE